MKLLVPIVSVKMSKPTPMILLASILAISLSLFTSPNAFATQVYESSIAKFEYPDNWKLVQIIGNGQGITLQPINEPSVYSQFTVYQDFAISFGTLVESIRQSTMSNGFQINEIIKNEPGQYVYSESGVQNGIDLTGTVRIQLIPNTNDVLLTEYLAEPSKYQQYNAQSGFLVNPYLSPQEVRSQFLSSEDTLTQPPSDDGESLVWDWHAFDPWNTGQGLSLVPP